MGHAQGLRGGRCPIPVVSSEILSALYIQLARNDETRMELARYHRATLGIIGPKRKPYLDIHPEVVHMLDMIVVTFVYIEKLHMDKERAAQRNSGTKP